MRVVQSAHADGAVLSTRARSHCALLICSRTNTRNERSRIICCWPGLKPCVLHCLGASVRPRLVILQLHGSGDDQGARRSRAAVVLSLNVILYQSREQRRFTGPTATLLSDLRALHDSLANYSFCQALVVLEHKWSTKDKYDYFAGLGVDTVPLSALNERVSPFT